MQPTTGGLSLRQSAIVLVAASLLVVPYEIARASDGAMLQSDPATFSVDTFDDATDTALGDGHCDSIGTTADGDQCTLRAAVQESDEDSDANAIALGPGVYHLTIDGPHEEHAATGDLDVRFPLTVSGAGPGTTVVDAGNRSSLPGAASCAADGMNDRIFHVKLSATVTMSGFTLTGGRTAPGEDGAALRNDSSNMTLSNMVVGDPGLPPGCYGNEAANGGGAFSGGGLFEVVGTRFSHNLARVAGGALMLQGPGATRISSSTFGAPATGAGGGAAPSFGDNHAHCAGGAIANGDPTPGSRLRVEQHTVISGNTTSDLGPAGACSGTSRGGGIYNAGPTVVEGSTISHNAADAGGAIYNDGTIQPAPVTLDLTAGAIVHNEAAEGAGLFNAGDAEARVSTSTISTNAAASRGGGVRALDEGGAGGRVGIVYSTIARNRAPDGGAGVSREGSATTVELTGSLLAENAGGSCAGGVRSGGFNLEDGTTCALDAVGDLSTAGAGIRDLVPDASGIPPTHALSATSPAVDRGGSSCPATDQRGQTRPQDGDLDGAARCDIGAYERVSSDGDEDGIDDEIDACPAAAGPRASGGCPAPSPTAEPPISDADGDGVADARDNCPSAPNGQQADSDGDGQGDACDEPEADDPVTFRPVVALRYDHGAGAFDGSVQVGDARRASSADASQCTSGVTVTIKKLRRGVNKIVATTVTDDLGRFGLSRPRASGRFYAIAPLVAHDAVTCARVRSSTVKVERP